MRRRIANEGALEQKIVKHMSGAGSAAMSGKGYKLGTGKPESRSIFNGGVDPLAMLKNIDSNILIFAALFLVLFIYKFYL